MLQATAETAQQTLPSGAFLPSYFLGPSLDMPAPSSSGQISKFVDNAQYVQVH